MKKSLVIIYFIFSLSIVVHSQTVKIGTQIWMTKDLDVDTFRNGDPIPQAKTDEEWDNASENNQPAWCYRGGNEKLYNWYAVNDPRELAPKGFHVPGDSEWEVLINFLGGAGVAGKKMKSSSGWTNVFHTNSKKCPNCATWSTTKRSRLTCNACDNLRFIYKKIITRIGNGSNSSGFTGEPSGSRGTTKGPYMGFINAAYMGSWWSATFVKSDYVGCISLFHDKDTVELNGEYKGNGLSVRCIKD